MAKCLLNFLSSDFDVKSTARVVIRAVVFLIVANSYFFQIEEDKDAPAGKLKKHVGGSHAHGCESVDSLQSTR
jgi:hypothetical protein